jgi:hypothetical protein
MKIISSKWFVLIIAVAAWLLYDTWLQWPERLKRMPEISASAGGSALAAAGQYGDQFGAFSSLLTGFTLLGVAYGVALQWRQLRSAEEQLHADREMRVRQEYERHFFQLLPIIERDWDKITDAPFHGLAAYNAFAGRTLDRCEQLLTEFEKESETAKLERVTEYLKGQIDSWHSGTQKKFFACMELIVPSLSDMRAASVSRIVMAALGPDLVELDVLRVVCLRRVGAAPFFWKDFRFWSGASAHAHDRPALHKFVYSQLTDLVEKHVSKSARYEAGN